MEENGNARLASLDALRGFDMVFIMGGYELIVTIAALCGYPDFGRVFNHAPWNGLQFMDTVFPLFLFLAGVSFPFSCAKSRSRGMSNLAIVRRCLRRFLILALLGCLGPLLTLKFGTMRFWSVLGRIGFAWASAALLYLYFRRLTRIAIAVLLLVGTLVCTVLLIAPDAATVAYPPVLKDLEALGRGPFTPAGNIGCWLDRTLAAGHNYRPLFDPEGFAGIVPSIVTAMLGMFAGEIVRNGRSGGYQTVMLLLCAIGCGAVGWALSDFCPINKALWSPSFVLVVGGYSFFMLALFHWLVDVKGLVRWTFFFRVIGMNSITIYMAQRIIGFHHMRDYFFGGLASVVPASVGLIVSSIGYVAVCWLFLYILYRKHVFLKI